MGWTNIWHSAMRYISKDRPGKTTDIEPKLPHLSSFGVRTKNFGEVLGNFYKMQATEQRLLSFPSGSAACSLNELSFNVFASFHSGSSRNPSRDEGTREELDCWKLGVLLDPSGLMAEETYYSCCQALFFHAAVLN